MASAPPRLGRSGRFAAVAAVAAMKLHHRRFELAFEQLRQHRLRLLHGLLDQLQLGLRRLTQHEADHRVPVARMADAQAQTPEVGRAQMSDEIAQAVVPGVTAAQFELGLTRRQIEFVMRHQNVLRRDFVEAGERADGLAGSVHIGAGLEQPKLMPLQTHPGDIAEKTALGLEADARGGGDLIDQPEAGVVAIEGVFLPGIAQADEKLNHAKSTGMKRDSLSARLTLEQTTERGLRREFAVEQTAHRFGDRHGHAVRAGELQGRLRGMHALGHMPQRGHDMVEPLPLRQRQADAAVARQIAGGGQYQIAQTAQAHEGIGLPAQRHAQPRKLGQPTGDERRARVVAQAHAVTHPGSDGQHILHRAAHLHAHDIGRGVDAHCSVMQGRHGRLTQRGVGASQSERHGQTASDLQRKTRAGERTGRRRRIHASEHGVDHRMRQQPAALLKALAQPDQLLHARALRLVGVENPHRLRGGPQAGDRHRQQQQAVGAGCVAQRRVEVGRNGQSRRQGHIRQIGGIDPLRLQALHLRRVAAPEQDGLMRRDLTGDARAPGTGAEHSQRARRL